MGNNQLNLFVWTEICPDYTEGVAIAIAETEAQAKEIVNQAKKAGERDWILEKPSEFSTTTPTAILMSGDFLSGLAWIYLAKYNE
jgi:hypothetical protein